jgi:hypothetical protein
MTDEERFADGNTSGVSRAGETVRRVPGPWTAAVHGRLHLERVGLDGVPRARGFDERLYADRAHGGVDEGFGPPAARGRRTRVFRDAAGLADRADIPSVVEWRILSAYNTLEAWAAGGVAAFGRLWRGGHGVGAWQDLAYPRSCRGALGRGLIG